MDFEPSTTSSEPPLGAGRVRRPDFAFMRVRASRWLGLGFGSGLAPVAPGTAGTLAAWLAAWLAWSLMLSGLAPSAQWVVIGLALAVGPWACRRTTEDLGVLDHPSVVWDEVVAFWIVLAVLPASFGWQLAGFLLFRFLDAVKPPPIGWADRHVGGGWGVMLDDLLAAVSTLLILAVFRAWG